MSDYGLNVVNNNSEVLIDSTYKNFALYAWGTSIVIDRTISGSYRTLVSFTTTTAPPIILMRPNTNNYMMFESLNMTGDSYDGAYFKDGMEAGVSLPTTIDVEVFTAHQPFSNTDYGLQVKNASGEPVFGSNDLSFKIYEVQTFSLPIVGSDTATIVSLISNPFYYLYPIPFWTQTMPGHTYWYGVGMKKINSTTVELKWTYFAHQGAGGGPDSEKYNPPYFSILMAGT